MAGWARVGGVGLIAWLMLACGPPDTSGLRDRGPEMDRGPRPVDAGPPDGGVDAGPDAGLACLPANTVCNTLVEPCTCRDECACDLTCDEGACWVECEGRASCDVRSVPSGFTIYGCNDRSRCAITAEDSGTLELFCRDDADCAWDATTSDVVSGLCSGRSSCDLTCTDTTNCILRCRQSAECRLTCLGTAQECALVCETRERTVCEDGSVVCGRDC